ncbi:alpha-L-rhamnosidase C-terminal domain-containing protein [Planctomycetota bacterium]
MEQTPTAETLVAELVRSDVQQTGDFSCSNELLNQQYRVTRLTLEDNWHSLPEDCPHREKCGWLGDAHATADVSFYTYDMSRFYTKYLRDIEDNLTQDERSRDILPHAAGLPTMVAPGKRGTRLGNLDWGVALVLVPWRHYVHTGDVDVFKRHYADIKNFLTYFMSYRDQTGTIQNGLGDWCPPRWDRRSAPEFMECHPYVSGMAFFYEALRITGEMATIVGDDAYSRQCVAQAEEICAAFNETYLKPIPETSLKHYGSQTATIMALKFGMVPDDQKETVVKGLLYDINQRHGGHYSCGIHGLRHFYTVLAELGQEALVLSILTDPTFPGPTFILNSGMTTWPERQFEWGKVEFSNSLNHPMQGGYAAFFHEGLGGIQPTFEGAGYKHITLKPYLTQQLDWVKTTTESPLGLVQSEWKNGPHGFAWHIIVPVNVKATVYVPCGPNQNLLEGGKAVNLPSQEITEGNRHWRRLSLGSGEYEFLVSKKMP